MINIKNIFFIGVISLFIISCSAKSHNINLSLGINNIVDNVALNTPTLCAYKGKISVKAIENEESMSFNAMLNKKCSNDISVIILGFLNSIVAKIDYIDDKLEVFAEDEIKEQIKVVSSSYMVLIKKYLKSPILLPNNSFKLSTEGKSYIFNSNNGIEIYGDEYFPINRYFPKNINITYTWKDDYIASAEVSSGKSSVIINFIDNTSWKGNSIDNGIINE